MRSIGDKNSSAAADYAAKRKEQLARAQLLRMERDSSKKIDYDYDVHSRRPSDSSRQTEGAIVAPSSSTHIAGTTDRPSVQINSYGDFAEHIIIRAPQRSVGLRNQTSSIDGTVCSTSEMVQTSRVTSTRQREVLARARISKTSELGRSAQDVSSEVGMEEFDESSGGITFLAGRNQNALLANSALFFDSPSEPSGRLLDLSDRPIMCSSSNMRNEVVFGGSDHALYAVDVSDPRKRHVQMYSKKFGHTDWVTSVAHLADGRVISASMDCRLCLWSTDRRSCVDVMGGHDKSISKVVTDTRHNVAISCGYDTKVAIWNFGSSSTRNLVPTGPTDWLIGHNEAVLDCTFRDNIAASGSRDGGLYVWDLSTAECLRRYRAHKGQVTALGDCRVGQGGTAPSVCFLTGGADGAVKVWDPREKGASVMRALAHCEPVTEATAPVRRSSAGGAGRGRPTGGRRAITSGKSGSGIGSSDGVLMEFGMGAAGPADGVIGLKCATVTCVVPLGGARGGGDISYVVSGGSDNAVVLMDARRSLDVVQSWKQYHRVGVYSMCAVGDSCVFVGDGAGMLMCYDMMSAEAIAGSCDSIGEVDPARSGKIRPGWDDGSGSGGGDSSGAAGALKYGLGASRMGAVRTINCLDGKVATGGEDGKALVFTYM